MIPLPHRMLLRAAALLVPRNLREDWLAEWLGEAAHVGASAGKIRMTTFCFGAAPDAFWLWRHRPREIAWDSPVPCLALLALAALIANRAAQFIPPGDRPPADVGFPFVMGLSLLLLPVSTRLTISGSAPEPGIAAVRRRLFFLAKLGFILITAHALYRASCDLKAVGAIQALIVACTLAFRWAWSDQRRRCPVCLRRLAKPVQLAQPPYGLLGWNGVETVCRKGHGLMHVPEFPSDWFHDQHWICLDHSWSGLFRHR